MLSLLLSEKVRSPGPVFDTTNAYEAILTKHSTPMIGAAGRSLLGSIYYDQFNLKSHGNYYYSKEAYLEHTTAPAARLSSTCALPPKIRNSSVDDQVEIARARRSPMKALKDIREGKKVNVSKYS